MNRSLTFAAAALRGYIALTMCLVPLQPAAAQTLAGRVVFAQGLPVAVSLEGAERGLARGNEVFSGDRLITDNGRLQLSMIDGAFVSVQPNSEYQIDNYAYSGTPDGTEIANYRLIKGGVRAVTGLIGRQDPEAYKVNTAIATIGVRGTGHNTRLCQGDCPGREDGLYHQTWEGTTFVVNDVDIADVPTGRGVYVRDLVSQIMFLDQPPPILALQGLRDRREREQEEVEERTRLVAFGDQRDETGERRIFQSLAGASTVLGNFGILGIVPDTESPEGDDVGRFGFEFTSSLLRRESDNSVIGFLGFEDQGDEALFTLATIDPAAVRGGDDAAVVSAAQALLDAADPALLAFFQEDPAMSAESFFNGEIGFGRWTDGRILVLSDGGMTAVEELTGFQSVHFLFGTEPPARPTSGLASYDFLGGTQSTSASGATLGAGVQSGSVLVDFGASAAFLKMNILHDSLQYLVSGELSVNNVENSINNFVNGLPRVLASGGACDPDCLTFIDGGFAGPAFEGFPRHIALRYDILAPDVIMGVAAFGFESIQTAPPTTVLPDSVFFAIAPSAAPAVETTLGSNAALFMDNEQLVGALYSEFGVRSFATVDVERVLDGNDPTVVSVVEDMLAAADQSLVDSFSANPAAAPVLTESFLSPDGVGWGRWTGGNVLYFAESGSGGTDVKELNGFQSVHFFFGPTPDPIPSTGSASYNLVGGTQSTSASGDTIGSGATSGSIFVDFAQFSGSINMLVEHIQGNPYSVFGSLNIDSTGNGLSGFANALTETGGCIEGCSTLLNGGFAGPSVSGIPGHVGIVYEIQDTDSITGVAGFAAQTPPN